MSFIIDNLYMRLITKTQLHCTPYVAIKLISYIDIVFVLLLKYLFLSSHYMQWVVFVIKINKDYTYNNTRNHTYSIYIEITVTLSSFMLAKRLQQQIYNEWSAAKKCFADTGVSTCTTKKVKDLLSKWHREECIIPLVFNHN